MRLETWGDPSLRPVRAGALLTALLAVIGLQLHVATPAAAVQAQHDRVVSSVPAKPTPNLVDGRVYAIAQVGGTTVIGGSFTKVQPAGSSTTYTLPYVVAFDASTGAIDTGFAPSLDGGVETLLPGPTAGTVYVGGRFSTVGGVKAKGLVLLDLSNGQRITSFKTPAMNGVVETVKRSGNRLYVGGTFTTMGGVAHGGIATLDATTGALDPFMASSVTVNHNWTPTSTNTAKAAVGVFRLDLTPDGNRLVAIGNFKKVDGLDRDQIAMWDLTGSRAVVRSDWRTRRYEPACYSWAYDSYVRDVDFAPDGSYFVVVTTGGGNTTLCDSAVRWETRDAGDDVQPTWVAHTGGDSLLSVAITGPVVYTGGHQRWMNNPNGNDFAGGGAVPRPGIAALDARTGIPLSWNPGRNPRGAGAYALLATQSGLWVGSDTNWIGNYKYKRQKIAFFPLTGGMPVASDAVPKLPGGVYLGASQQAGDSPVLYRVNAGGPSLQATDNGPDWMADESADSTYRTSGSNVAGWDPVTSVDSTVPAGTPRTVFDSERWDPGSANDGGEMSWAFPVPGGQQVEVRVYLANRCSCTSAAGSRQFDVALDGVTKLDNFDISASAGDQTGTMRSWTITSDGTVNLDFIHEVENPLVNAIEIVNAGQQAAPVSSGTLTRRNFDGATAGPAQPVSSTLDFTQVRGASLIGGVLYYGKTDGNLYRRTFNGSTFGQEQPVDPYNDPVWSDVDTASGQTYRGTKPSFYGEIPNLTSTFYDGTGRLYYTLYGKSGLFYRSFSPDSGMVYPNRSQVPDVSLPDVTGAFLSGGSLYYVTRADGNVNKVGFSAGQLTGSPQVVSGPDKDGVDWRSKVLFLGPAGA